MQKKIKRINELAAKAKSADGLTEAELQEQKELRTAYLKEFRGHVEAHLHTITVVDAKGTDITPQKLRDSKKKIKN